MIKFDKGLDQDTLSNFALISCATLVDNLDTLWILDMKDEFDEAVDAALQIEFGPSGDRESEINMFEIIIRYLGGFIGAYDVSACHDARLLDKALEVADMAYASFDTPNRMPVTRWKPQKAADGEKQLQAQSVLIAEQPLPVWSLLVHLRSLETCDTSMPSRK
jgi:mannosyl-oligosaccharide alpha-1,2-mannosidase